MPLRPSAKLPYGTTGYVPFNLGLPRLSSGQYLTAQPLNDLSYGIDKTTIRAGEGYQVQNHSNGVTLKLNYPDIPANPTPPLTVMTFYDPNNASPWNAYVIAGTVNQIIPKIGSHWIDDNPIPYMEITYDISYVCVKATHSPGEFFPSDIQIVIVDVVPDDTETEGYFQLAGLKKTTLRGSDNKDFTSVAVTRLAYGNLVVNRLKAGTNDAVWWWDVYNTNG